MKVMIAEDEILVRLGLRKTIPWPSLGMELVCEAQDGAEARDLFRRHLPDIVLVDIEMPHTDGLTFIRQAKAIKPEARFIVLTCHQEIQYTREAIQLQVSDFLLKSTLDMEELRRILQHVSFDLERERGAAQQAHSMDTSRKLLTQLQYYDLDTAASASWNEGLFREALSESEFTLKQEIAGTLESLHLHTAKRKLLKLHSVLKQHPFLHPSIVKNMVTEFLFRAWSAFEAVAPGVPSADHRLVDQIYGAPKLEQTFSLLTGEMDRLESHLALTNTPGDKAKVIALIKQYIKTHLQQDISLQDIAGAFHMNSSYLSRLFKEISSVSFTEFMLYEKTELAIMMMKNGQSLTEISEKLGYLNLSSFTRMFKKVRGVSPSRYFHDKSQVTSG